MSTPQFPSSLDLYNYLKETDTKLVSNTIFDSPGHQVQELDNFIRAHRVGHIRRDGHYLLIQRESDITNTLAKHYAGVLKRDCNLDYVIDNSAFGMSYEITRMMPELCVDVNLSHLKHATAERKDTHLVQAAGILFYGASNQTVQRAHYDYFKRRQLTRDFDPWSPAAPAISDALADFLGGRIDRIAVVHFRDEIRNASIPIVPESLFSSLAYLRDNGFTIVKIGTERYPPEFAQFGVIDYSNSKFRSFENDIALMKAARVALVNASGIEALPDLMNVPLVSYGRWHLTLAPQSPTAVIVPALMFDKKRERIITFAEQIYCFLTAPEYWEKDTISWRFPVDRFYARPPQEDEMLAALQEALELGERDVPRTALQERFAGLEPNGCLPLLESRISHYFLEKFPTIL